MKRDIEKLKSDMADVRGTNRRIVATLVRLEEKVDGMADDMKAIPAIKADIRVMKTQLDDFTADVQAARRDRARRSA